MSINAADLIYPPPGEIRPEWFPGEDVPGNLAAWITESVAIVPDGATADQADAIARAYAYAKAYDAKLMLMAGSPDSITLSDLARTITQGRTWFSKKAAQWAAALADAIAAATPEGEGEPARPAPRPSVSTAFKVAF